ncbi:MAG: LysR family transcriptional regulator [Bdellovibrionales bacterium]|nr:LysR family transcriptional regulator [Bdellovibrionales bacterium]
MDVIESIRIFRRVAETKSFSRVAKESQVSQPTISKLIQGLEKHLDLVLFRRTTRGLSLTVEGQKLYNSGGDLIDHFERVLAEVKSQKLTLKGELRVSASLAFARLVLAPLFQDFSKLHPELRLSFVLSDGFTDLVENNIDVAFRIGDLADSTLKAIKIGTSRRSLYASKEYLKKSGRPKTLLELHSHRLLYYTRLDERPRWPLHSIAGVSEPFYFEPFFKTDGSDLMREAVLNGMGIALLPTWMLGQPEKEKLVERLFETNSQSPTTIFALSASSRELNVKQRAYIEFLRGKFESMPALTIR